MQTLWLMCLKINWECNSYSCIFVWDQVWIKIVVKKVLLFSSTFLHGSLAKSNKNSVSGIKILAYDIARPEEPGINHSKILFWHLLDQNKFYPQAFCHLFVIFNIFAPECGRHCFYFTMFFWTFMKLIITQFTILSFLFFFYRNIQETKNLSFLRFRELQQNYVLQQKGKFRNENNLNKKYWWFNSQKFF